MNLLAWIVTGLLVGLLSAVFDPRVSKKEGVVSVILGLAGAMSGGFLSSAILGTGFNNLSIPTITVSVVGALLLLFLLKAIRV